MTATPTQRQRVRAFTDALPDGEWTKLGAISAHIGEPSTTTSAVVSKMVRSRQLVRRGKHPNREYRSGPVPVTAPGAGGHSSSKRVSKGFMELARLSRNDPKEYARLTRADRGFRR